MVTKAVISSINRAGNRCIVRMPLFETAANSTPVEAEALISITPGLFNNLFVGDIVFVAFEENAIEKPIIIGKLYKGMSDENNTSGGAGILDTFVVKSAATVPASTLFTFPENLKTNYKDLKTPKKMADYIKWLERLIKKLINQLDDNFRCFKNWIQWKIQPENLEIDDGDIDKIDPLDIDIEALLLGQKEGDKCKLCDNKCTKANVRSYLKVETDKSYPDI